jgi:hypothetical protein
MNKMGETANSCKIGRWGADVMTALRALGVISGTIGFLLSVSAARADQTFHVCAGEGDGPSCQSMADIYYTCDEYTDIRGGSRAILIAVGNRACKYIENGQEKHTPFRVERDSNVPGGKCGWTMFTVTCLSSVGTPR